MSASILITAVTGSGKSTACKTLQNLGYNAYDIESIDGLYELVDEKTGKVVPGNLDQIGDGIDWNCNRTKLEELLNAQEETLAFYCGGMANTEEILDVFDHVIVLTVSDDTTLNRLSNRQTGEFGSTEDNRNWVLSWKHNIEKAWLDAGAIPVSAEESPEVVARLVIEAVTTA